MYEWFSFQVYYIGFIMVFGVAFSFMNITVTTLFSKVIGPRPQVSYYELIEF